MAQPMPTEFEEKLFLNRADIANRLRALADQIAQGSLSLGSARSSVPEQARYEVDFEVKPGKGELKIEIEWR